jgi:hypothetical protein
VKLEITGESEVKTAYQIIPQGSPGIPVAVELSWGWTGKDGSRRGYMSCDKVKKVKAQVYCDQLGDVAESMYLYTADERRSDAWQRLRDLNVKIETRDASASHGHYVDVWFFDYDELENIELLATISGGAGKECSATKVCNPWKSGERADLFVQQSDKDMWKPKHITLKITDKISDASVTVSSAVE